jgi:hypothetical protein
MVVDVHENPTSCSTKCPLREPVSASAHLFLSMLGVFLVAWCNGRALEGGHCAQLSNRALAYWA